MKWEGRDRYMAKQKIYHRESDFKTLRKENFLYVDKTWFIAELEALNSKYPIFLRPRQFGKTLLVSTLDAYYDRNSADEFKQLFSGTYIGAHKTQLANQYYVLRFNFSGLLYGNSDKTKKSFREKVEVALQNFIDRYHLNLDLRSNDFSEPASLLNYFLTIIKRHTGKRVFVMVDDYDDFANNIFGNQAVSQGFTEHSAFVRNFYEIFKVHTEGGGIDRIFITGVTPMTLDSLTSGFNIAKNVSMMAKLNEMVGFTAEETRTLLEIQEIEDLDGIMRLLVEQCGGYRFCKNVDRVQQVLNSNLVLCFLDQYQEERAIPDSLIDDNIHEDYSELTKKFTLFKDEEACTEIFQDILAKKNLTADIVSSFTFSSSFDKEEFLSMLYYLGLLTIEGRCGSSAVKLKIPNMLIQGALTNSGRNLSFGQLR